MDILNSIWNAISTPNEGLINIFLMFSSLLESYIILVIIGHSIQYGSGSNFIEKQMFFNNYLFKFIYSFHMPLFIMISGYLSCLDSSSVEVDCGLFGMLCQYLVIACEMWNLWLADFGLPWLDLLIFSFVASSNSR